MRRVRAGAVGEGLAVRLCIASDLVIAAGVASESGPGFALSGVGRVVMEIW